jgi:PAS domain-containing protein
LGGGAAAWFTLPGIIYRDLRDQVAHEMAVRREAEIARDAYLAELLQMRPELAELRLRANELVRAASLLQGPPNGLGDALDRARDGIAFSSSAEGGRLLWVNAAFAQALGMERREILRLGWQRLIHPDDQARAQTTEGRAHGRPVSGVAVRYRRAAALGGGWIWTRWWCPRYYAVRPDDVPQTVCVVWLEEPDVEPTPSPSPSN